MTEQTRRLGNRDKLLAYLQEHRRASNVTLAGVAGLRFGGRVHELRGLGHDILTEPGHGGLVYYTYRGFKAPGQIELTFTEAA